MPTRNRPDALAETLRSLSRQSLPVGEYEVIVVDDGSAPPVRFPPTAPPTWTLVRLDGRERSAARNEGVRAARGEVVAFVDDDISVEPNFLKVHLRAQAEWPAALIVGAIRLPDNASRSPFGRFRQTLEEQAVPTLRGVVSARNLCSAANMSIARDVFLRLNGFDEALTSAEDQDFALRHTARGGRIVFLPEARVVHRDTALDLQSYCSRVERGSEAVVGFCRRHPDWPDNLARERVNGPLRWGADPVSRTVRKLGKQALSSSPVLAALVATATTLEITAPDSAALDRLYRLLLGLHIFRGYRRGLRRATASAELMVEHTASPL